MTDIIMNGGTTAIIPPRRTSGISSTSNSTGTTAAIPPSRNSGGTTILASSRSSEEGEEGLLRDVLNELDRERSNRAELQAQIRKLNEEKALLKEELDSEREQQQQQAESSQLSSNNIISRREFLSMQAQVEGYKFLVGTLTSRRPAIAAAHKTSIPIHVLRLLEIIPWDAAAQEYIFGVETLFEWQIYDARERKWQSHLRCFPVLFRSLPIVKPKAIGGVVQETSTQQHSHQHGSDRSLLLFLAGAAGDRAPAAPSNHGTLTDERLTKVYNIEAGFPLPEDQGTWQWVGGWRVEKHDPSGGKLDCDDHGWSYAKEAQHFLMDPKELVWDSPARNHTETDENSRNSITEMPPTRPVRRRKWTRRRILVDYPYASERTKQYLNLLADNARLTVTVDKVSDQLVSTKTALTETEEELFKTRADLVTKERLIKAVVASGKIDQALLLQNAIREEMGNPIQGFLSKNEQVKEIGSKISQWVQSARKTSEDSAAVECLEANIHENKAETGSGELGDSQNKFDWKKIAPMAASFTKKAANSFTEGEDS